MDEATAVIVGALAISPEVMDLTEKCLHAQKEEMARSVLYDVRCRNCSGEGCLGCQNTGFVVLGFSAHDVPARPQELMRLVYQGILRVSYKSRSSTNYMLQWPVDAVEDALKQIRGGDVPLDHPETPHDLFDVIAGYDDLKDFIRDALGTPGVHMLCWGPPATAKSLFLLELRRMPGAAYRTGSYLSKAGLAETVLALRPRFFLIDEVDKLSVREQDGLLSLMEQGELIMGKQGKRITMKVDLQVFATANRVERLLPELRSRWMEFYFKPYSREDFVRASAQALSVRYNVDSSLAVYTAEHVWERQWQMGAQPDPRDVVQLGRLCRDRQSVDRSLDLLARYRPGFLDV